MCPVPKDAPEWAFSNSTLATIQSPSTVQSQSPASIRSRVSAPIHSPASVRPIHSPASVSIHSPASVPIHSPASARPIHSPASVRPIQSPVTPTTPRSRSRSSFVTCSTPTVPTLQDILEEDSTSCESEGDLDEC